MDTLSRPLEPPNARPSMPKKKPPQAKPTAPPVTRQMNIRVPDDLYQLIEATADTLGLDPTNFLRMVIKENMATYVRRADQIRHSEKAD